MMVCLDKVDFVFADDIAKPILLVYSAGTDTGNRKFQGPRLVEHVCRINVHVLRCFISKTGNRVSSLFFFYFS